MSVEDLLHHIRKEASYDDDDDGKPGWTAGQQLHEYKVHVLGMEEWPDNASIEERKDEVEGNRTPRHEMVHPRPEMSL